MTSKKHSLKAGDKVILNKTFKPSKSNGNLRMEDGTSLLIGKVGTVTYIGSVANQILVKFPNDPRYEGFERSMDARCVTKIDFIVGDKVTVVGRLKSLVWNASSMDSSIGKTFKVISGPSAAGNYQLDNYFHYEPFCLTKAVDPVAKFKVGDLVTVAQKGDTESRFGWADSAMDATIGRVGVIKQADACSYDKTRFDYLVAIPGARTYNYDESSLVKFEPYANGTIIQVIAKTNTDIGNWRGTVVWSPTHDGLLAVKYVGKVLSYDAHDNSYKLADEAPIYGAWVHVTGVIKSSQAELDRQNTIHEGDIVKVVSNDTTGWYNTWSTNKDPYIGHVAKVTRVFTSDKDTRLVFADGEFRHGYFPLSCLKKQPAGTALTAPKPPAVKREDLHIGNIVLQGTTEYLVTYIFSYNAVQVKEYCSGKSKELSFSDITLATTPSATTNGWGWAKYAEFVKMTDDKKGNVLYNPSLNRFYRNIDEAKKDLSYPSYNLQVFSQIKGSALAS